MERSNPFHLASFEREIFTAKIAITKQIVSAVNKEEDLVNTITKKQVSKKAVTSAIHADQVEQLVVA